VKLTRTQVILSFLFLALLFALQGGEYSTWDWITLRHEEIKSLGMPQMTMVFRVSDPALLERVKAGDKVRFTAEKVNGAFTLTSIEAVP